MRNIFDQYDQPENKLTHALVSTLSHERRLIRPFLHWLKVRTVPPTREIRITEQEIPGSSAGGEDTKGKGLPDACFYNQDDWAIFVESKVQAGINRNQLRRHLRTARRYGCENPHVILIAVESPVRALPRGISAVQWSEVYSWFRRRVKQSEWAAMFVDYMQTFESKMLAEEYNIQGTITMFDGLRFDEENPYTYRESKRLIRLLGDELQKRNDLKRLGIDPRGKRRGAITGRAEDRVWDFLPMKVAKGKSFTAFPHLTIALWKEFAEICIIIPNSVKGGFRTKLKRMGPEGFYGLISELEARLAPVISISKQAQPIIYILQRHYKTMKARPQVDCRMTADLRTIRKSNRAGVKHQPEWINAVYPILVNKRANIQLGVGVRFPYDCPVLQSRTCMGLFAKTWIAMKPLLKFVVTD